MVRAGDIDAFIGITGATMAVAEKMLDMCGDLEQAVQLWFADEDLQRTVSADTGSSIAAVSGTTSQHGRLNRSRIGREDEHGVIHIDSDDDAPMTEVDSGDDTAEAANIARKAQEEEDAAMAKRLQEELYSAQVVEDNVRAPIARRTETLIGPDYGEDDPHSLMLEQFRRRQHQARSKSPRITSFYPCATFVIS
jgi:Prephenate dehydratase